MSEVYILINEEEDMKKDTGWEPPSSFLGRVLSLRLTLLQSQA